MKKTFLLLSTTATIFMVSCNNTGKTMENTTDSMDNKQAAKDSNDKKFDSTTLHGDSKFAVAAADGGMLEVALGKLALAKTSSAAIKNFAQMMVTDHSKANDEFKILAAKKNMSIPAALGTENQHKLNEFAQKSGADFDKEYAAFMIDDHKEDIDEFKKEVRDGEDADIKSWAAAILPVLDHHLQMAKSVEAMVKSKKK